LSGGQDSGCNDEYEFLRLLPYDCNHLTPKIDVDLEFGSLAPVAGFVEGTADDPMHLLRNLASSSWSFSRTQLDQNVATSATEASSALSIYIFIRRIDGKCPKDEILKGQ
jgi:hypothetical protein